MIKKTVLLECTPARAFALFTESAGEWWPESRRHTSDPRSEIQTAGERRFYERAARRTRGGARPRARLGAARRLVLDFFPGTDADHPTAVVDHL
jgi:hypothetical protein